MIEHATPRRPVWDAVRRSDSLDPDWNAKSTIASCAAPPPPSIDSNNPLSGPAAGGASVTIDGSDLGGVVTVTFGGVPATDIVGVNDSTITVT